jgi:hypothetical protein
VAQEAGERGQVAPEELAMAQEEICLFLTEQQIQVAKKVSPAEETARHLKGRSLPAEEHSEEALAREEYWEEGQELWGQAVVHRIYLLG